MRGRKSGIVLAAVLAILAAFPGCSSGETGATEPPLPVITEGGFETAVTTAEPAAPDSESDPEAHVTDSNMEMIPLTETPAMFELPTPAAPGTEVLGNEKAEIDVSNKTDGYIMAKYLIQTDKKLVIQLTGPSGTVYQYIMNNNGDYDVLPLSDGNGEYKIGVYENTGVADKYSVACTASFSVELTDEFAPFIRPNQYVNYNLDSKAVKKSKELTEGMSDLLERIGAIYYFVIDNISYDKELAEKISTRIVTEYLPDIDAVLESGKGICFDYAALMTAMLRSQGIPTKLVVGYAGSVYHAWINVYSEETGWMDSVIYFDGNAWKLMDPTYASSGGNTDEVNEFIGDGTNYTEKLLY